MAFQQPGAAQPVPDRQSARSLVLHQSFNLKTETDATRGEDEALGSYQQVQIGTGKNLTLEFTTLS